MQIFSSRSSRLVVAIACLLALASAPPAGAQSTALAPNSGRTATIDGKPVATDGKTIGIQGKTIVIDGKPVLVDGRPMGIDGKTIVIDGKTVVRNGQLIIKPAPMLVFTIDLRWPGASSYRIGSHITSPIERAVRSLPGVREIQSSVTGNRAQTRVSFESTADAPSTAAAIRHRLDQIKMSLPRDASSPLVAWRRETEAP